MLCAFMFQPFFFSLFIICQTFINNAIAFWLYICKFTTELFGYFICTQLKINVLFLFWLLYEFLTAGYQMSLKFHDSTT